MTNHYGAWILTSRRRMKDTALPNVAVILLFLLWISTAGCIHTGLAEPADSSVPTAAPSETAQPSAAIAISDPTPAPPETAQPPTPAGARPAGAKQTRGDRAAPVAFPRHNAPLGTDSGEQYTAGKLILEQGCLRLEIPARGANPRMSRLLIWPNSFTFQEESGTVRVMDGLGRVAAQVGDHIRVSRAAGTYQQARDQEFTVGGVGHCANPSTWVGDEVAVFDPQNEATVLRLSDPDVLFLRRKTVMAVNREFLTAGGSGELILDGQCLRLKGEYNTETIIWPAGFTPHIQDGVVQVRNGADRVIAQVGDEIAVGHGYYEHGHGECSGEAIRVYGIKVRPDVEVYFPRQDEFLKTRRKPVRFTGELVLNGICLEVENVIRVGSGSHFLGPMLPIWPGDFELRLEDGAAKIADSTGRVIARVGDQVQFSAFGVPHGWALRHGGVEEITLFCDGSYWAVGNDFRAVDPR